MKKMIVFGCIFLFIVACALPFLRADHDVAFTDMQKTAVTLVNTKDFKVADEAYIRKQYELNKSDYDAILCYGAPSAMEVNEFTIVEVQDENKKEHVVKQLQKRIAHQVKSFSGYAPRQEDILKKAVLYERGDYVIMIIHTQAETMKESINALF